ncbi:C39 family peptidase [Kitasatospora sp. NPDC006697]|uniref:C39 family peptidase n=1 Tax=Kitasatospora sp. NPDC006697 TaxID=3364020 RepID=UPI0036780854
MSENAISGRLVKGSLLFLAGTVLTLVPTGAASAATAVPIPEYSQQLNDDCEASALRMVLAGYGVDASDEDVLAQIGVDREHYEFGHDGPLSGDPFAAFVGDPDGSESAGTGYGVYYPPVASAAQAYGLTVVNAGQGISPDDLRSYLANGNAAVIWTDFQWQNRPADYYTAYDGQSVPYAGPGEHAVVVTDYTDDSVSINDPYAGQYSLAADDFDSGYNTYGQMAVVLDGPRSA